MKRIIIIICLLPFLFQGCKDDATATDISVTTTESIIIFEDETDLLEQINTAISYNYGSLSMNQVDSYILINEDTSSVVSRVEIKDEYKKKFEDSDPTNNSVIIELYQEEEVLLDNLFSSDLTAQGACDIYDEMYSELPNFNFNNLSDFCVPVVFHQHNSMNISQSQFDDALQDLNDNFSGAKIQFQQEDIVIYSSNQFYDLDLAVTTFFPNDVPNTLNIYISNSLKDGDNILNGKAHFPDDGIERVYIRDVFFNTGVDIHSAVLSHEIGHFFLLFHTFETALTSCSIDGVSNCQILGDGICDTPQDNFGLIVNSPTQFYGATCNPLDFNHAILVRNFMSYALGGNNIKNCDREFVVEQNIRMRYIADKFRSDLQCNDQNSIISVSGNLDFGDVTVGQFDTRTFTITNTGNTSFDITNENISSSVFTTNLASQTVEPGEVITVTVFFSPTQAQDYDGFIEIITNAEFGNNILPLSGTGVMPSQGSVISLSGNMNFGSTSIGSSSNRTLTISNIGTEPFNVTSITAPTGFSANWSGTIAAGDSENITVTFEPDSEINYQGSIVVNNNADSGNYTISCSGTGVDNSGSSAISLSGNLNFGNVNIGDTESRTLTISNTGTESFNVSGISPPTGFTANWSGTIAAGDSENITVTFQPTSELNYQGSIVVNHDADSGSNTISCSGNGVDNSGFSEIDLNGNLNFGNVEVGGVGVQSFTISNVGTEPFSVTNIIYPYNVYSSSYSGGTIPAGGTQNVSVLFQPTNDQSYNGVIQVFNTADSGSNIISVSGTGTNPTNNQPNIIYVEHAIAGDDNSNQIVEAGEAIDLNIRLENIGNATANNIEAFISTSDSDIDITDDDRFYDDMPAGDLEWNGGDFNFDVSNDCPTKTVTFNLQIVTDEGTFYDSFQIQVQGTTTPNPISITPTNSCSTSPIMQVDTEYEVNINTANYTFGTPIDGESHNGANIRGFWLSFQVPSNWSANHDVKIYDVSSNFDPVFGIKAICTGGYLAQTYSPPYPGYVNDNGYGGNETSDTNLPGSAIGGTPDDIYHVRIYHYYGNETPNISFKIKVE